MNRQSNLFLYATIVLVATLNLCLSNPATSSGTTSKRFSETPLEGRISSEDSNYRKSYATHMLSFMNHSVNPCTDFYEYACGNWENVIEERYTITKRNNLNDMLFKLDDFVENILQRSHINDVAPEYAAEFELAKKFYNSCLEAKLYPMQASPEYLAFLKTIGGFPAVDASWSGKTFDWLNMSAHLSNYGINTFVAEGITTDYPFGPYFKIPDIGFDIELQQDTINNRSSNAYKANEKRMREILNAYGVKENHIEGIITKTFNFLKKIVRVIKRFSGNCINYGNYENENLKIRRKWRVYNDIAWMGKNFKNITKDFEDCCTPCYLLYQKIDSICKKSKRAAANYLSLKFLFDMDARLTNGKFQKGFCISQIRSSMEYFFDHLYMKMYFSKEIPEDISYIIREIRDSLRYYIKEAHWLDETTRKAALLKESTMAEYIGRYENTSFSKLLVGEIKKKLEFVNGNYEKNNFNLRKFKQYMTRFNGLNFEKLGNTARYTAFSLGMQTNALYHYTQNYIYLMAGIFMTPVYNKAWPNSLKFGTLGFQIAHKYAHGFDTSGVNFDAKGHINNWFSDESTNKFEERVDCYADHYERYLIPNINHLLSGVRTTNEYIADGEGLRVALKAYRRYAEQITNDVDYILATNKEDLMPGINLSPEQLFFLGFAQMYCASLTEAASSRLSEFSNAQISDKYRVLGALANNADFAKAYNCSLYSGMNPSSDKCIIW